MSLDLFRDMNTAPIPAYQTEFGQAYCMDTLDLMRSMKDRSVNLIMTSPPYPLIKKKEYGNEDADRYVQWFLTFASEFKRILADDGSLVINIAGAYERGQPTRSLCHFEVLLRLCRDPFNFHLAQEFYWFNPAKMPAPAQWVTVRRVRVKDSVEPIWWLSKRPDPKATNRNVLVPYGDAMKTLLKKGYNDGRRPSGHDVSKKWGRDHGGAIPSNVIEESLPDDEIMAMWEEMLNPHNSNLIRMSNTSSNDRYRRLCKQAGVKAHPATFPLNLPKFFIKFLTNPNDIVFDPFGGSGTTGSAAQLEGRRWITCDNNSEYVAASRFRFPEFDNLTTAPDAQTEAAATGD